MIIQLSLTVTFYFKNHQLSNCRIVDCPSKNSQMIQCFICFLKCNSKNLMLSCYRVIALKQDAWCLFVFGFGGAILLKFANLFNQMILL